MPIYLSEMLHTGPLNDGKLLRCEPEETYQAPRLILLNIENRRKYLHVQKGVSHCVVLMDLKKTKQNMLCKEKSSSFVALVSA